MGNKLKSSLVRSYYYLRYPKARQLSKRGVRFDHFRELNKKWLLDSNIKTVLDVGANEGQYAKLTREVFPDAKIFSFEPLPDCYDKLVKALPGDQKFTCFNMGVGSGESVLQFFRSIHSPSSSFLKMEDLHKEAFPYTSEGQAAQPIDVKVNSLDNILPGLDYEKNVLLKIDVQGFEGEVIKGASSILREVKVIILEMSLVKLYKDQPLFHDIYMMMHDNGFRYHGNLAQMLHPKTDEVVQLDAIFIRE